MRARAACLCVFRILPVLLFLRVFALPSCRRCETQNKQEDKVLVVLQKYRGDLDGLNAELRSKYSVDLNSPSVQLQYTKWLTLGRH